MNNKERLSHSDAEEEAEILRKKVESKSATNYSEAEKQVESEAFIKELEVALEYINRNSLDFRNINFHLRKVGMFEQANELLGVSFKRIIRWAIDCIQDKQPPYFTTTTFFDKFGHAIYDGYESGLSTNYYKAVGKFAARVKESQKQWFAASEYYETVGEIEEAEKVRKILVSEDTKIEFKGTPKPDWKLVEGAAEEFINEAGNDPILKIDDEAVILKVREEIEQKLVELKSK